MSGAPDRPAGELPETTAVPPNAGEWDDALDHVACLRGKPRQVEKLAGGPTNINVEATSAMAAIVVRIAPPGGVADYRTSVVAAQAGVGAPVLEYVPDPGLLVVGFIDGRTFSDDGLRSG